jgi:F5/8 type C domain-containing protein/glutamine amidotransferase class I
MMATFGTGAAALLLALAIGTAGARAEFAADTSASTTAEDSIPSGAVDGDRFATAPAKSWRGKAGAGTWWWQIRWTQPRDVGAILQVVGDSPICLRHAPRTYVWQGSMDGSHWQNLAGTAVANERRTFRVHRLRVAHRVRFLRMKIDAAEGDFPVLREVEFHADPRTVVSFPEWAVVVSTTGSKTVPGAGTEFIRLARGCGQGQAIQAQNIWLGDFNEAFLKIEPYPLCAFLSGNFIDWCQQRREDWRGVQEVLNQGRLPMWAACGGMQGLAILAETGVDRPWDCPQCRTGTPKLPIYTHIAGSKKVKCGDYSGCIFERGPHTIVQTGSDPVFAGLPREFKTMESHCGQIGWTPKGWVQIATCGPEGKTKMQCMRVRDRCIYAAQFHIEMDGTPESSRKIMSNFLNLARQWDGYRAPVAAASQ